MLSKLKSKSSPLDPPFFPPTLVSLLDTISILLARRCHVSELFPLPGLARSRLLALTPRNFSEDSALVAEGAKTSSSAKTTSMVYMVNWKLIDDARKLFFAFRTRKFGDESTERRTIQSWVHAIVVALCAFVWRQGYVLKMRCSRISMRLKVACFVDFTKIMFLVF